MKPSETLIVSVYYVASIALVVAAVFFIASRRAQRSYMLVATLAYLFLAVGFYFFAFRLDAHTAEERVGNDLLVSACWGAFATCKLIWCFFWIKGFVIIRRHRDATT